MLQKKFSCEYSVSEAIGSLTIWILLSVVSLGLALFVLPYYFIKAPINRTYILDANGMKIAKLSVEVSFADILGHALIWVLLTVITFGLAYLIYWPAVIKRILNAVKTTEL